MKPLEGKVAVVTGASRGAGRGIACVLGEAGATVYVTGRSARGKAARGKRPETINETAEMVTARGGRGIAVRCDYTRDMEVEALFARVKKEQRRLDILVNNAWGGYEEGVYELWRTRFWKQSLRVWDAMFSAGVRSHMVTGYFAAPLLVKQKRGLVILTTVRMPTKYHGVMSYDVAKTAINRMAFCMAEDFRKHKVAVVALAPGWMRTERVLEHFKTDAESWRKKPELAKTESPEYTGRAVVALATDPRVMERSGKLFDSAELAREYGFRDIDGRQVPPFRELFPELFKE